jgi:aldehyde:ferredoxin oxidoreductase
MSFDELVPILNAAVGENYSTADLQKAGERIWNLERLFNLRAGVTRADDSLPNRLLQDPFKEGPSAGVVVPLEPMLDDYYNLRGWTPRGEPTAGKLIELGLV